MWDQNRDLVKDLSPFLSGKEFIKLLCVGKAGGPRNFGHRTIIEYFKAKRFLPLLFENQPRFTLYQIIVVHVKQQFLAEMQAETGKNGLESYWKLGCIGGPLDKMKFTHESSLADFARMQI